MHPVDKPFDMTQLSDESESWLTKTTERLHIAFNDEWFQFDYYVDHAPKNPKVKPLPVFVEMFTAMTFARRKRVPRSLTAPRDTILQNFARGNLLVHGRVAYLSADRPCFLPNC